MITDWQGEIDIVDKTDVVVVVVVGKQIGALKKVKFLWVNAVLNCFKFKISIPQFKENVPVRSFSMIFCGYSSRTMTRK